MNKRSLPVLLGALIVLSLWPAGSAQALRYEFDFGEQRAFTLQWDNRLTAGVGWRIEAPDSSNIAKAQLDPQLCAPDDCIALTQDDTAPNERFLAAPGALQSFTDDAGLNYAKGDIAAATAKWTSRLSFGNRDYGVNLGWLFFYDPVNEGFREFRPNQIVAPGPGPGEPVRFARPARVEEDIGSALQLREANVYVRLPSWTQIPITVTLGRQNLLWGEAAFTVQGSINAINPPDANNLVRPGFDFDEIYRPQNMLVIDAPLSDNLGLEAFYQLEWRPYGFPAKGSFISFFDAGNDPVPNEGIPALFGKNPSDPLQQQELALPVARLVTDTSLTLLRGPNREPPDTGQFGFNLNWFVTGLTSAPVVFSAYFANYHSRLPSASATATEASCARREGNPNNRDSANFLELLEDCDARVDLATVSSLLGGLTGIGPEPERITNRDVLPIDTGSYFLDYAQDVRLFGLSFNAELFGLAVQGELAYRPNQPVQVDIEDVLFAAFQPVFPRNTIDIGVGPVVVATLAESQRAIPDFITAYRGGEPGETVPGSYVRGYERMKVWHPTLGLTKVTGASDWFGADQAAYLLEISADYIPDLPPLSELQLQGPGTDTHYSDGIFETGDALKINPIATRDGFVTRLSWGYRAAALLTYQDVLIDGLVLRPLVVFTHDVSGVGVGLAENFIEGRKLLVPNLQAQYRGFSADIIYLAIFGGGRNNTLRDRDAFVLQFGYEF